MIAYVYGVEDPRTEEMLRLAGALGVEPGSFFAGLESFGRVDRDERIGRRGWGGGGPAMRECTRGDRSAISTVLDRAGRLVEPPSPGADGEGADRAGRDRLSAAARARVIHTLEGDLDCLVDDAADRGITERSAEELLLTSAVLDWLRDDGELPGKARCSRWKPPKNAIAKGSAEPSTSCGNREG